MALNLDTEEAVDYGAGNTPLLNVSNDFLGEFDLALLGYVELVSEAERELRRRELAIELGVKADAITDDQLPRVAYNGACDIATVQILASDNDAVKPGSAWALWFDQDATGKAVKFAAGRIRQFMAACMGEDPKSNQFKANNARQALLSTDLSSGEARVHLSRRERQGKGEYAGQTFGNDRYSPLE
jgi:hypothetical protein